MALLVYKFSNYENTAEREQYRSLCKKLKSYYGKSDELCIFIANFNIYDCELDGIIIKQDAIIAVEFKNYKGEVIAVDNGEWKLSGGTIIKGGSRKTVYQQANLNHVAIKRGFKDGKIVEPKQVRDVAALVVFHQPITLVNNLSPKTQSWLHVCDETDFLAKVQDITSKTTDLSLEQMLTIIERLNLSQEYLDKTYSNKDFFEALQANDSQENNAILTSQEAKHDNNSTNGVVDSAINQPSAETQKDKSLDDCENEAEPGDEDVKSLSKHIDQILSIVLKGADYQKSIFRSTLAQSLFDNYNIRLTREFVIVVQGNGIHDKCAKLSRFICEDVKALKDGIIYWQCGGDLDIPIVPFIDNVKKQSLNQDIIRPTFRKSSTTLPHWLDCFIFDELGAVYSPFDQRYEYNLNLNDEEIKVYLGTYFPRSYAEMFCITDNLLQNKTILETWQAKANVNIFDFGCGTGGELIGLLTALSKYNIQKANVHVYDGNELAIQALKKITIQLQNKSQVHVDLQAETGPISSIEDIERIANSGCKYDIVLCDKMICELISKRIISSNAYAVVADKLSSVLTNTGLLVILDVTTKDGNSNLFYPQLMNKQLNEFVSNRSDIETLLPFACSSNSDCRHLCFMQQQFTITHSRKVKDISKVCYRILSSTDFISKIFESKCPDNMRHIVHRQSYEQDENCSTCSPPNGGPIIDSFNINIKYN